VDKASSSTSVSSSGSPSDAGDTVTFTATVTGVGPSGSVEFDDGGSAIAGCATQPLTGGTATCVTSTLAVGDHSITAAYGGDASNLGSTSGALVQEVDRASSSTSVSSSGNPSAAGDPVTLTATVTGASPSGSVEFDDGGSAITGCETQPLTGGTATCVTSALAVGDHSITAAYGGDGSNLGSTSAALVQEVDRAPSTTTVTSSANPSTVGDSVTLTATVTGASPSGAVEFDDGGSAISGCETQPLSGGTATCVTGPLTLGSHTITAVYGGDASNLGGTSVALAQTVSSDTGGSSGSGSSTGSSGSGTTTSAAAPTSTTGGPGSGGTLTTAVGAPGGGTAPVSLSWSPASFAQPVQVQLTPAPVAAGGGFAAGSLVVSVVVTDAGNARVTSFDAPLVLHFPASASGTVPAYSPDGIHWTPIPVLRSPALPAGQPDGYFVNTDGSIDVYTRHATDFAVLEDTESPTAPGALAGTFAQGRLTLRWGAASDNLAVAGYRLYRNGALLRTLPAGRRKATLRSLPLHRRNAFAVRAIDAAGHLGGASAALVVRPLARPAAVPRRIPRWAWQLLAWQHRGARPVAAPKRVPTWYWQWASWRLRPFAIA
jgi:hypothetical protein